VVKFAPVVPNPRGKEHSAVCFALDFGWILK